MEMKTCLEDQIELVQQDITPALAVSLRCYDFCRRKVDEVFEK